MKYPTIIVQCAAPGCTRSFETSSRKQIQYCETCRKEFLRKARRRYEKLKRVRELQLAEEPEEALNVKLDQAEFTMLYDAGPEEGAFRRGAKLSQWEVYYMLKDNTVAENSILLNNQTQVQHRVVRGGWGRLRLEPRWEVGEREGEREKG